MSFPDGVARSRRLPRPRPTRLRNRLPGGFPATVALPLGLLVWLVLICGGVQGVAQGTNLTWRWSNPAPFGNSITDLAWRTNRLYLAVGDRGSLWVADELPD